MGIIAGNKAKLTEAAAYFGEISLKGAVTSGGVTWARSYGFLRYTTTLRWSK